MIRFRLRGGPLAGHETLRHEGHPTEVAFLLKTYDPQAEMWRDTDTKAVYGLGAIRYADPDPEFDQHVEIYCDVYTVPNEVVDVDTAYYFYKRTKVNAEGVLRTDTQPQDLDGVAVPTKRMFQVTRQVTAGGGDSRVNVPMREAVA